MDPRSTDPGQPPLTPASPDDDDLAALFGAVSLTLMAEDGLDEVLARIAELAVETIPNCEHCGVMLMEGGDVRSAAVSDQVPRAVDAIQIETGEGPCLEAMEAHEVFEIADMRDEARWPVFASRAATETPVRSMLSFRLYDDRRTVGALNLFAKELKAFDESDHQVGGVFAAYAALALTNAREVDGLRQGLESRTVIATAKGMLMAREGVTDEEAFAILRRASQRMNVKLREVAQRVVEGNSAARKATTEESQPAVEG